LTDQEEPQSGYTDHDDELDHAAEAMASLLSSGMFSEDVQDYVDLLLERGENPRPELRRRLTAAAERGLDHRRREAGPLPTLLAARRAAQNLQVHDLASELGVSANDLSGWESGSVDLRTVEVGKVAAWARHFDLDSEIAVAAMRLALERMTSTVNRQAAAAGRRRQLSVTDLELLRDFEAAMSPTTDSERDLG
jgi:transcriptional regulator with XRE-family HTH domain